MQIGLSVARPGQAGRRGRWAAVTLILVVLSGCGGGGGGGSAAGPAALTVSGRITAAAGSVADGDVNDPNASFASNDTLATAQAISNPATVGGYANAPGTGEVGRSRTAGDAIDLYRVALVAGQVLTLTIGDPVAGDLDLFLLDPAGNLVASSEGVDVTETLGVPASGTYLIGVFAFEGAANYVLVVGQGISTLAAPGWSTAADFVPGELLARFAPAKPGAGDLATRLATLGLATTASPAAASAGPVRVRLAAEPAGAMATTGPAPTGPPPGIAGHADLEAKWRTLRAIKQLARQSGVRYAEPNFLLRATVIPNDPGYPLQWHYPLVNLPQAWDITTGNSAVIVAVVDSGVLSGHPDLQGRLVTGYDFVSDPARALDGDGRDANPEDPGDLQFGGSSSFHGTHVAGTVAAASNNGSGVAGVAWNARIMPLRALGAGGAGTLDDINQALLYAARLPNASGTLPAQRADIVNLSLGGPGQSLAQQDIVNQVRGAGVIVIASAGNDAQRGNPVNYPAAYAGVVSVGAVTIDKGRAPYSTFNAFVDVAAPGGDMSRDQNGDGYADGVLSTLGDDSGASLRFGYVFYQGTSMAAPHVAGVAALMKAVNPALTPAGFDALLVAGQLTLDVGPAGRDDQFGYGLVDAYAAVVAAQGTPTPLPPQLVATPNGLNFGTLGTSALLSLFNGGGGSVTVTSVTDDAAWLTVGTAAQPATGLGARTLTINRAGLAVGTYSATITINSTANSVSVPVIMQVVASNTPANAGFHYVLLVDPETGETRFDTQLNPVNGVYQFSIAGVAPGRYVVITGSDYNNDQVICDAGEACGAYPTLDTPAVLDVNSPAAGIDFGTGLNTVIESRAAGGSAPRGYRRPGRRRATP
jgi:serine protease